VYRKKDASISLIQSAYFLIWSILLIASVSLLIAYQNFKVEQGQRKNIAYNFFLQVDTASEHGINIALAGISDKFLQNNFERLSNETTNHNIKDSIAQESLGSYLTRYETHFYTFDKNLQPLFNEDSASYYILTSIIQNKGKPASIPGLYYYQSARDNFTYVFQKEIHNNSGELEGYFFLFASPKLQSGSSLLPEIFKQSNDIYADPQSGYAFGLYSHGSLVKDIGEYNFSDTISKENNKFFDYVFKNKNGYSELWYNAGNHNTVLVALKNNWFMETLTLFSYLFSLFIAVNVMLYVSSLIIKTRFRKDALRQVFYFNIKVQIQTTVIAVTIFSFLIIGIATISFFVMRFNTNNRNKLVATTGILLNEIESSLSNDIFTDDSSRNINAVINERITKIAAIHSTNINYFDVGGNLQASSQPFIFQKRFISDKMEPAAYYALHYERVVQFIQEEHIGDFKFLSMYVPVRDEQQNIIAYLNVPYLNSQTELDEEISNFLVTLINLMALIFVLAGSIALIVTGRITSSFALISNKMKEISLGKTNEVIEWKRNDEIGTLVREYNKMVRQLERSAKILARSEREGAWREMARQVAHEIKNPLTPMKLSIQYLQRAVDNNASNVKELSEQVAKTLIEQIDQLSKIAGDFSQFANIGNVKTELFDIGEVLGSLVTLYNTDPHLNIKFSKDNNEPCNIEADKTQINRLFTNLIKNAIEASVASPQININIHQHLRDNFVEISVKDFGSGIPVNAQTNLFTPNFTTKSSGAGLGLAICKGIVEKANGTILFTTKENIGTTFYVRFPLVK
jgi:signal transduction histidine kinase